MIFARTYLRALHVVGFLATLVLMLGKFDVITPDQFDALYAPVAWCCYNVWGFVVALEAWIEVAALGLACWEAFAIE